MLIELLIYLLEIQTADTHSHWLDATQSEWELGAGERANTRNHSIPFIPCACVCACYLPFVPIHPLESHTCTGGTSECWCFAHELVRFVVLSFRVIYCTSYYWLQFLFLHMRASGYSEKPTQIAPMLFRTWYFTLSLTHSFRFDDHQNVAFRISAHIICRCIHVITPNPSTLAIEIRRNEVCTTVKRSPQHQSKCFNWIGSTVKCGSESFRISHEHGHVIVSPVPRCRAQMAGPGDDHGRFVMV